MSRVLTVPTFMLLVASVALPATALAKPWNGIEPGVASAIDVIAKFGEPTKKAQSKGKDVLVYSGDRAINGNLQVQFKVEPKTQVVERIDLYPTVELKAEAIEKSYGPECVAGAAPTSDPCFYRKETASKHAYYLYLKLGLAIFFKDDNTSVKSFSFLPSGAPLSP